MCIESQIKIDKKLQAQELHAHGSNQDNMCNYEIVVSDVPNAHNILVNFKI